MPTNTVYYILIAAKSGVTYKQDGEIVLFPDRTLAASAASALSIANPDQHYLIEGPHTADRLDWRARERARLADGSHKPLLPALAAYCLPDHFAHVAKGDPGSLAYTKHEADGVRDIQKRMNVIAYLKLYAPGVGPDEARELQTEHSAMVADGELLLAKTADEIVEVYTRHTGYGGVGASCMRHSGSDFHGSEHPVTAYGDSDLAVAYVTDDRGRTSARSMVWPARRCYSRLYGDERSTPELQRLLLRAGYKASSGYYGNSSNNSPHSLVGARIRAIPDQNKMGRYIVPYVDEGQYGSMDEAREWITIVNDAPPRSISIKETSGVALLAGPRCPSCRTTLYGESDLVTSYISYPAQDGVTTRGCMSCTFICAGTGVRYSARNVERVSVGGQNYARGWADANLPMCGCCRTFKTEDQLLPALHNLRDPVSKVCATCAADAYFWCEDADMLVANTLRLPIERAGVSRKKVTFGDRTKLIDRGHSIMSHTAANDPLWVGAHLLAVAERDGGPSRLAMAHRKTGMPLCRGLGMAIMMYPDIAAALSSSYLLIEHELVLYTPELEQRLPQVGDAVSLSGAFRFAEATGKEGMIVSRDGPQTHPLEVLLSDGRIAYCSLADVRKLSANEQALVVMRPKPEPREGDRVMFSYHASPRFGQVGVIDSVILEPGDDVPLYRVRFSDGTTRRGAASRIQLSGEQQLDLLREPRHYVVGDRVRFTPECIGSAISTNEIGRMGSVVAVKNGKATAVRSDRGEIWATAERDIEYAPASGVQAAE